MIKIAIVSAAFVALAAAQSNICLDECPQGFTVGRDCACYKRTKRVRQPEVDAACQAMGAVMVTGAFPEENKNARKAVGRGAFWTDAMKMGNSYSFSFGYGITLYDSDGNLIKAKSDRPFVILAGNNEYQPKGANRTFEAICTTRRASCTAQPACPTDFSRGAMGTPCYHLSDYKMNYNDAIAYCQARGGMLSEFYCQAEQDAAINFLSTVNETIYYIWIGAKVINQTGMPLEYQWESTGDVVPNLGAPASAGYHCWEGGEYGFQIDDGYCLSMARGNSGACSSDSWGWGWWGCHEVTDYAFCQA